jgi:hypothetical protein
MNGAFDVQVAIPAARSLLVRGKRGLLVLLATHTLINGLNSTSDFTEGLGFGRGGADSQTLSN